MNLLFAWLGGGLWIFPLITFLACVWCFYRGIRQHKSGSQGWVWEGYTPVYKTFSDKVPFFSIGSIIFGIIFFVATVVILIAMYSDR